MKQGLPIDDNTKYYGSMSMPCSTSEVIFCSGIGLFCASHFPLRLEVLILTLLVNPITEALR